MSKATYIDGFVLVVPKKRVAEYRKMAREACVVWKKFGALRYHECMIDDAKPKDITFTFSKMATAKPSETVWFSYIEYKSKAHRNQVNKKVMTYFNKKYDGKETGMENYPFDMKRFAYAGFKVAVTDKK